MLHTNLLERRRLESLSAADLAEHQRRRLNALLKAILPRNRFYADKLAATVRFRPPGRARTARSARSTKSAEWPFTFKEELQPTSGLEPWPQNLTFPRGDYTRYHQTSGTRGRPMAVLDTAEDWQWWLECWQYVLDAAGVAARRLLPDGFFVRAVHRFLERVRGGLGPRLFGGADRRPDDAGPAGTGPHVAGARLIFSTPSYALHLAEVGADHQIDVATLGVRRLVLAGEPGGSIPHVRAPDCRGSGRPRCSITAGPARSAPGAMAIRPARGMHVMESQFIAEFLSLETGDPAAEGELAELVLTSLGRIGSPVIRYRTGDLVRFRSGRSREHNRFVLLEGGIVGRVDDMLVVRGVNIFPSSLDQILRSFPEVVEYRTTVETRPARWTMCSVEVEDRLEDAGPHRPGIAAAVGTEDRSRAWCRWAACRASKAKANG